MKVAINTSVGESKVLMDEEQACGVIFARIPYIFVAWSLSTPREVMETRLSAFHR